MEKLERRLEGWEKGFFFFFKSGQNNFDSFSVEQFYQIIISPCFEFFLVWQKRIETLMRPFGGGRIIMVTQVKERCGLGGWEFSEKK